MTEPGFELYAAPFQAVLDACSDETLLGELRRGALTSSYVHFPPGVDPASLLLFSDVVGQRLGRPVALEIERQETDLGLFVDKIDANWAAAIARLDHSAAAVLQREWAKAFFDQEQREPPWAPNDLSTCIQGLIVACQDAVERSSDVVMVWSL